MAQKKKKTEAEKLESVVRFRQERSKFYLFGSTPIVFNRQSEKVKREMLLPKPDTSKQSKQKRLKHEPLQEFLDSPYKSFDDASPTLLVMPAAAIKKALRAGAMDMEDSPSGAAIGRLTEIVQDWIPIYGVPELWMTMIRQAGIARTPDVRTRAIIPSWVAVVEIDCVVPNLNGRVIGHLMANAGMTIGIGDGRQEKGTLKMGKWLLSGPDDVKVKQIIKSGGRAAQIKAMKRADFYDTETEELFSWFEEEASARRFKFKKRAG